MRPFSWLSLSSEHTLRQSSGEKRGRMAHLENFLLSFSGVFSAVRALQDVRSKQKEVYNRLSVISDNLQF